MLCSGKLLPRPPTTRRTISSVLQYVGTVGSAAGKKGEIFFSDKGVRQIEATFWSYPPPLSFVRISPLPILSQKWRVPLSFFYFLPRRKNGCFGREGKEEEEEEEEEEEAQNVTSLEKRGEKRKRKKKTPFRSSRAINWKRAVIDVMPTLERKGGGLSREHYPYTPTKNIQFK